MGILLQVFGCLDSLSCQHSCMESSIGVLHMAKGHLTQPHTPQLGETVCSSSLGVRVPAHTSHHWILATMSSAARFGVLVRMRDLGTSLSHGSSGAGSPLAVAHSHKHQQTPTAAMVWCQPPVRTRGWNCRDRCRTFSNEDVAAEHGCLRRMLCNPSLTLLLHAARALQMCPANGNAMP